MAEKEIIDRCVDYLLTIYQAMDGTHQENRAALAELLGGDDYNAARVLRSWMLLPPRMLLEFQCAHPADEDLRDWLENVIDW